MTVDYYAVSEATWCPANTRVHAGFTIRDGAGGGKRVSAATLNGAIESAEIRSIELAMEAMGQTPLFMIRDIDEALDAKLQANGYEILDPVNIYSIEVSELAKTLPPLTCFSAYPPLAIMKDIWTYAGIKQGRFNVMDRVDGPKTALLGRAREHAAGVAFVAIHEKTAMIHALEVKESLRRQGVAVNMMRAAANWAQNHGAMRFSVIVTQANQGGNALYASLGMKAVGKYHYRIKNPKGT